MNRYDWIVVGMCLYGIHIMVTGILGVLDVVTVFTGSEISDLGGEILVRPIMASFIGSFLILLSLKIASKTSKNAREGDSHGGGRAGSDV